MPEESNEFKSALEVKSGVNQPPAVNRLALAKLKGKRKSLYTLDDYITGIREGNRTVLSQAITLIESSLPEHQVLAQQILTNCLPFSGNSIRLGITGVPGVGKSSFIESFGMFLISRGRKVAVLAIDPSSSKSRGSILGDKTRMEQLSMSPDSFIRPSPSAGSLGGVARKTRETMVLCEAAGFDVVIVETVGVGQSEIAVHSMVDFFLLLMIAGAGDELQGIKRGIMEMADAIIFNKADGDNMRRTHAALSEMRSVLHFFHPSESGWSPVADSCSAHSGEGIPRIWEIIEEYMQFTHANNFFNQNRLNQSLQLMHQTIETSLIGHFYKQKGIKKLIRQLEQDLKNGTVSAYTAASMVVESYLDQSYSGRIDNE